MPPYVLSILHVSDLHARSKDDVPAARRAQVEREAYQRQRVLGQAWDDNLRAMFPDRGPDLVCMTGDVADWGVPQEYAPATAFVERLRAVLSIGPERIYVVPGNHDVQRTVEPEAWAELRGLPASERDRISDWMAGGRPPRAVAEELAERVLRRSEPFWAWVEHELRRPELVRGRGGHPRLGYRHALSLPGLPFEVQVVGLDSAWLAGDDHDAHALLLTRHQLHRLAAEDGQPLPGFRLALLHHPIDHLADADDVRRELAELTDMVLHGHQHTTAATTWADPDKRLRVLAAGCLYEGSEGDRWASTCQRIDLTLDERGRPLSAEIRFRAWSTEGFWHDHSGLYARAPGGRLSWDPWLPEPEPEPEPELPLAPAFAQVEPSLETPVPAAPRSPAPMRWTLAGGGALLASVLALAVPWECPPEAPVEPQPLLEASSSTVAAQPGTNASDASGTGTTSSAGEPSGTTMEDPGVDPETLIDPLTGMTLVHIPAGRFMMGSPPDEPGYEPDEELHEAEVASFWMCKTEVTYAQWQAVMPGAPQHCEYGCRGDHPVTAVRWSDAVGFLNAVSERAGLRACYRKEGRSWRWDPRCNGYRLPTETEWEYAARAGSSTAYGFGEDPARLCKFANLSAVGAGCEDGHVKLAPVASFLPNAWQLYDVHGNAFEWVWDWYGKPPSDGLLGYAGPKSGSERVIRGGSLLGGPANLRVANRAKLNAGLRVEDVGFRCARGEPL